MNYMMMVTAALLSVMACNEPKENEAVAVSTDSVVEQQEDTTPIVVDEQTVTPQAEEMKEEEKESSSQPLPKKNEGGQQQATMPAGSYHMVVSFFSPGNGINREALEKFQAFLKEQGSLLVAEETRWGREGEVDYCIRYEGSAAANPASMSGKIRRNLSGFDRINFTENAECIHKR